MPRTRRLRDFAARPGPRMPTLGACERRPRPGGASWLCVMTARSATPRSSAWRKNSTALNSVGNRLSGRLRCRNYSEARWGLNDSSDQAAIPNRLWTNWACPTASLPSNLFPRPFLSMCNASTPSSVRSAVKGAETLHSSPPPADGPLVLLYHVVEVFRSPEFTISRQDFLLH